jgi:uncharacterized membrane protein HdeD (DUF308 family)
MYNGDRTQSLAIWVVIIGVVTAAVGLLGICSPGAVIAVGNPRLAAAVLLLVGLALIARGVILYRMAKRAAQSRMRD